MSGTLSCAAGVARPGARGSAGHLGAVPGVGHQRRAGAPRPGLNPCYTIQKYEFILRYTLYLTPYAYTDGLWVP